MRSKLEDALRTSNGIRIPERILNLEAEGNRKYKELSLLVLQETQSSKKSAVKTIKVMKQTPAPLTGGGKPVASLSSGKGPTKPGAVRKVVSKAAASRGAAASSSGATARAPKLTASRTKPTARKATGYRTPRQAPTLDKDGFEILDSGDVPRKSQATKQTTRMGTGVRAPKKRDRSPGIPSGGLPNKRVRTDDYDSPFGFLAGTYNLSAPAIREEWEFIKDKFRLVVKLDSVNSLFGAFHLGIASGVLRSIDDIEAQADGASANFEWCGEEENGEDTVFPPDYGLVGTLQFTRKQNGRHTLQGVIEEFSAAGRCEFTGEKISDTTKIAEDWDDYCRRKYQETTTSLWQFATKEAFLAAGEEDWDAISDAF